jgi:hypothetical protein
MPLPKHILVNLPPKPLETSMVSFPKTTTKTPLPPLHQAAQRRAPRISLAGRRHYRESINVDASRFIPFSRQQLSPHQLTMHTVRRRRRRHRSRPHRYCLLRPPVPKGRAIDLRGNLHMIYAQDTNQPSLPALPNAQWAMFPGYIPLLLLYIRIPVYIISIARFSGCMSLVAPI